MSRPAALAATTTALLAALLLGAATATACPDEMAHVGASCVDRWEASLVTVDADGEHPWSPYVSPTRARGAVLVAVSRPHVVPQAYLSMSDARLACSAAGKRLCRAGEWKAACRGPGGSRYPYGQAHVAGVCVDTHRASPIAKLFGALVSTARDPYNDPRLNQLPNTVAKTGEAEMCTNQHGVYDMVGNLHEWVDDGTFRGGYYLDTKTNREGCDYVTTRHVPYYHDYSIGFRCCLDADTESLDVEPDAPAARWLERLLTGARRGLLAVARFGTN